VIGCAGTGDGIIKGGTSDPTDITVTGVTVSPLTSTVNQGGTVNFGALVTGTNVHQSVTWSVASINTGGVHGNTKFALAVLQVSPSQTPGTLTVRATSIDDPNFSGYATVTVIEGSALAPAITGVSVEPMDAPMAPNSTRTFTATLLGTNLSSLTAAEKGITWTVNKNKPGTNITSSASNPNIGTLYVAEGETGVLTVRATSTYDTTKIGIAMVTITNSGVVSLASALGEGNVDVSSDTVTLKGTVTLARTTSVPSDVTMVVPSTATLTIPASVTLTVPSDGVLNVGGTLNVVGILDGSTATGVFDGTVKVTESGILKVNAAFGTPNGAAGSIVVTGSNAKVYHEGLSSTIPQIGAGGIVTLGNANTVVTIRAAARTSEATFEVAGAATVAKNLPLIPGQWVKITSGTTEIASAGTISGLGGTTPPKIVIEGATTIIKNSGTGGTAASFQNTTGTAITTQTSIGAGTYVTTAATNAWGYTWKKS
jgi:hypothetical protein